MVFATGAIVVGAAKAHFGEAITGTSGGLPDFTDANMEYGRLKDLEVPFNSARKMMMTIHKLPQTNTFGDVVLNNTEGSPYTHCAIIKGAPDRVCVPWSLVLRCVYLCLCTGTCAGL